jgi:hypothetical protein
LRWARRRVFALGQRSAEPACLVEQAANASLAGAFRDAEDLLLARLRDVTLGRLSTDFRALSQTRGLCRQEAQPDDA